MKNLYKSIFMIVLMIIGFHNTLSAQKNNDMEKINSDENLFIYHLVLTPEYNNPEKWTTETYKVIQEHSEFIDSLGRNGTLIFAGRTKFNPGNENLFGIAVIKASSIEVAKKIMQEDPAVLNSIQMASIFPFSLGIRYFNNLK